ncbi:MAG: PAS domain S-box protein, partial [Methanospirillum sp.]|nr:PAS domain S-box protein [Methanospirillum sp.]
MIRVLHIDDEADFLFISKKILEGTYGFEVFTAETAKNGFAELQAGSFDAVISDYMLPDMDGLSLLQIIRDSGINVPFIFCTGRGREDVVIDAINRGADYYLQKGGDTGVLFAELAYKIQKSVHHQMIEGELKKSEEKYRRIVETIREGIWHINQDGYTVFVNHRMADMLGYEVDEVIGSHYHFYLFPEDIPDHEQMMRERFQGVSKTYERRFLRKDGSILWTLISGTPVYENGQITGSFGTITDITGQKRNEDTIRNSEIEFRTLFENTRAATLIFDDDALITRVNEAFAKLWGHSPDEIENKRRWTEFIHPDDLGYMKTYHENRVKNPETVPSVYEFRFIDSAGDIHYILANIGLIPGTSRRIASLLDITPQKMVEEDLRGKTAELQASYEQLASAEEILRRQYEEICRNEMALQESYNLYRAIFENTGNASIIIEEDYSISLANTGWEHLSGYTKEEIEGRMVWTDFIPPEDITWMKEYHRLRRVHPGDAPGVYESRFLTRSGEIRDVISHVAMIPGTKKSIASLLDITKRKKAEDAVRASEKKYRELFGNITDGVILYQILPDGKAGRILEANRVMEEWLS